MRGQPHIGAALLTSGAVGAFGVWQNHNPGIGGRIHWSKVLWLSLAVKTFVVLPGVWWHRSNVSPVARRMLGLSFGSFVIRGAVEMYLVYVTRSWKMRYGISHDVAAITLLGTLLLQGREQFVAGRDDRAVAFGVFKVAALVTEVLFAVRFRVLTNPADDGVFFADDSPRYERIIRLTKRVVVVAYPLLAFILWRARRDFERTDRRMR